VNTPDLSKYKNQKQLYLAKSIFRVASKDLNLMFDQRNLAKPENKGEAR
jgi:hypothetical protein